MPTTSSPPPASSSAEAPGGERCTSCGAPEVRANRARSAFWHGEALVVVEDIPALVCGACGEQFYEDATVIALDRLRGEGFPPGKACGELRVPVFSFGGAGPPER